jgi:hypothetical protein
VRRIGSGALFFGLLAACVPAGESRLKDAVPAEQTGADAGEQVDLGAAADPDAGDAPDAGAPDLGGGFDSGAPPPPDSDGDGIPDSEDPSPMRANPSLFHDVFDGAVQEWVFSSVSMEIDEFTGVLRCDVLEPLVREGWIGPRPAWSDYFARTSLRVGRVGTSTDEGSGRAGLIIRVNQVSPDRYLLCSIDFKRNLVVLSEHNGGGPRGVELATAPTTAQLGEWLPMHMRVAAEYVYCTIGQVSVEASSSAVANGSIGFRAFDATFEADFLDVYDL